MTIRPTDPRIARKTVQRTAPEALHDVALIDAPAAAAAATVGLSTWYALVAAGEAPQPVIRRHRFTRWRLEDVRNWLIAQAGNGDAA